MQPKRDCNSGLSLMHLIIVCSSHRHLTPPFTITPRKPFSKPQFVQEFTLPFPCRGVAALKDGRLVIAAPDGVHVWEEGTSVRPFFNYRAWLTKLTNVQCIAVDHKTHGLFVADHDTTFRLYDFAFAGWMRAQHMGPDDCSLTGISSARIAIDHTSKFVYLAIHHTTEAAPATRVYRIDRDRGWKNEFSLTGFADIECNSEGQLHQMRIDADRIVTVGVNMCFTLTPCTTTRPLTAMAAILALCFICTMLRLTSLSTPKTRWWSCPLIHVVV